jgi:hypothetical protein
VSNELERAADAVVVAALAVQLRTTTSLTPEERAGVAAVVEALASDRETLKTQNAELLAEINRLKAMAHVPGLKRCAKCGFQLLTSTMHVESGALGANNKPVDCLNGCGPMWPVTERQAANEAIDREEKLKAQNADLVEALTHVTDLLNDPGVGDLEQWKRGVREWTSRARALAKAGGK